MEKWRSGFTGLRTCKSLALSKLIARGKSELVMPHVERSSSSKPVTRGGAPKDGARVFERISSRAQVEEPLEEVPIRIGLKHLLNGSGLCAQVALPPEEVPMIIGLKCLADRAYVLKWKRHSRRCQ
ncbi:hypothetical protein F511_39594 [Dorcoceras hygrometricum]|uniref:Uncharacterized protein n=1 Tax=Dorcoceras hygrometricum TaxID=472368 RepID=A0A2Z7AYB8_9LAMI|nr:hypothetical protein F511_39594 [Dorcoceras hygrometricum]